MSRIEVCPSKTDRRGDRTARDLRGSSGKAYWRSLDDLSQTDEFREFVEREFPAGASELLSGSRRSFLRVMGASLALAGAATIPGCRRPDHRIVAFNEAPEFSVPGKPLFYATALPLPGGGAEGLLAETHDGRPTKLEGNPLHPHTRGRSSLRAQASILWMYDPDRNPGADWHASRGGLPTMDAASFRDDAGERFARFDATRGAGLAFLVEKVTSPSRDRLEGKLRERWPEAVWVEREAVDRDASNAGARLAFGRDVRPVCRLEGARVVASLDRDLLGVEGGMDEARGFAAARYVPGRREGRSAADAEMSRLYTIESGMTLTGAASDHRLARRPERIGMIAVALADAVLNTPVGARGDASVAPAAAAASRAASGLALTEEERSWVAEISADLVANPSRSLVVAGETQPAEVHALTHAMNVHLGNVGRTVEYLPVDSGLAASSSDQMRRLAEAMRAGRVEALVTIGGNPVYDAPADLGFADLYAGVGTTVYVGDPNETAAASTIFVARAHPLETWGDVESLDGAHSVCQPMIKPLWGGMSDLEALAAVMGESETDGFAIVRRTLASRKNLTVDLGSSGLANPLFDRLWRRTLHDGLLGDSRGSRRPVGVRLRGGDVAAAVGAWSPAAESGLTVVFRPCGKTLDGRDADNGWLQELPDPVTKVSWDNLALVSRRTAERLGLRLGRKLDGPTYNKVQVAELTLDGRTVEVPIWVQPGMPDDVVQLTLGYGRTRAGRVGTGVGYDAYAVRPASAVWSAPGASLAAKRGADPFLVANTQDHWSMEDRDVFREVDLHWWRLHGDELVKEKDAYGVYRKVRGGSRLGMESHTPVNRDAYKPAPGRGSSIYYHKVDETGAPVLDDAGRKQRPENKHGKPIQQWGMSIDLTTCTGCGACTVACQAENNIPIVGKMEVAKGREMHWIRVDRYYASDTMDDAAFDQPDMAVQPVPCMQCESAPCEVVCPVNATVHGPEGTNDMAYNRCIGTRYCSNNCPYKVRRFNYFDYATKQFKGWTSLDPVLPESTNDALVPPRLREKIEPVAQLRNNPNVTVRSRGVMEKCTYCMQRINLARVETKLEDLDLIPDGFFQTACQQSCPTGAITFGDIYDYESNGGAGSAVHRAKDDPRTFAMLAYLNITPRTTYQVRVRNTNERLRPLGPNPFEHGHHGGDHGSGGHAEDHHEEASAVLSLPVLNGMGGLS
jgi:MoCo/4Fe-4S cofactor protein with predicted Tat translocation signal